jgi:hypothetical protein
MSPAVGPALVIGILAFCIEVIAGAAYFYSYESHSGKIRTGWKPGDYSINAWWYMSYSVFCFGLISLLFAIAELGLIIQPEWFSFVDSPILRAVVYILKGIATLGMSNDLGIAAGSMEIIIGAVMLIFAIINLIKGGSKQ